MFRKTPAALCARLANQGDKRRVFRNGQMWGVTANGSQIRVTLGDGKYLLSTLTPGNLPSPSSWEVRANTKPDSLGEAYDILRGATCVPAAQSLYGIYHDWDLAVLLMTRVVQRNGKLAWTIFRNPAVSVGQPEFTKTTGNGTFLDPARWWRLNPRRIPIDDMEQAGPGARLVYRDSVPAAITIDDRGRSISAKRCTLFAPRQALQPVTDGEWFTARPLADWASQ